MIPTFQLRYIKNYILKPEGQNPPKILSYGLRPELCEDLWSKLCVYYICVCVIYMGSTVLHGSMDWFKGKSTGNHGFYHQI